MERARADAPVEGSGLDARGSNEIVKELISDLIKDGWEPLEERGTNWENFRFRRQVK
jgi:hypothetical protein